MVEDFVEKSTLNFFLCEFNMEMMLRIMLNFLFIDLTENIWSFVDEKFLFNFL